MKEQDTSPQNKGQSVAGPQGQGTTKPTNADIAARFKGDPMQVNPQLLKRIAGHVNGKRDELVENWAAAFVAVYGD